MNLYIVVCVYMLRSYVYTCICTKVYSLSPWLDLALVGCDNISHIAPGDILVLTLTFLHTHTHVYLVLFDYEQTLF